MEGGGTTAIRWDSEKECLIARFSHCSSLVGLVTLPDVACLAANRLSLVVVLTLVYLVTHREGLTLHGRWWGLVCAADVARKRRRRGLERRRRMCYRGWWVTAGAAR